MITNLGNDVFIDFEPDEFQLKGWAKFRQVPKSPVLGMHAQTRVQGLAPTFDIAIDGSDIVVTRVQGHIRIARGQTWVVTGRETPELLEHEQGHYYITYIPYVLALQAIRSLQVPMAHAHVPRGASPHQQQTLMHNAAVRRIQPIVTQSQSRMTQLTSQYDMAVAPGTNHGINRTQQQQWNQRFAQSLASGTAL